MTTPTTVDPATIGPDTVDVVALDDLAPGDRVVFVSEVHYWRPYAVDTVAAVDDHGAHFPGGWFIDRRYSPEVYRWRRP